MTDVDSTSSPQVDSTSSSQEGTVQVPLELTLSAEPVATPEAVRDEAAEVHLAESPTAQMPGNEPLASEHSPSHEATEGQSEPHDPAQDGPTLTPAQEPPPQAAASVPVASAPAVVRLVHDLLAKAHATIQTRKQKRLAKILATLERKSSITNDEVEKLLRVSDATATRYLSALEKEGKIRRVGKTGNGVVYTKP